MKPFLVRLLHEKMQLRTRVTGLGNYLNTPAFNELNDTQKELLKQQHSVMTQYLDILEKRIKDVVGDALVGMTPGQKAIRTSFNPSKFPNVDAIKDLSAALYDELNNQMSALFGDGSGTTDGEHVAQYKLAMRKVEEASMRGVGAATYGI